MSGFSRVSISESLRRTIDDIKEIAGQHSDEDIYLMLKDCNMDPNETAQKLLYLDTFHEVKRKRDRKKVQQGTRGGGNNYSSYSSAGGRQQNVRRNNSYSGPKGRDSKSSVAVVHKESNKGPAIKGSTNAANGSTSSIRGLNSQLAERNTKGVAKVAKADCDDMSKRMSSLRPVTVKQFQNTDPGPTPTSTPTNTSTACAASARNPGGSLRPKSTHVGNSVGLYSSATDPVLVPSLNPRNPGSVGIIKRETGNQRNAAETSGNLMDDSRANAAIECVTFGQLDLTSNTQLMGVGSGQAEYSRLSSSTSQNAAAAKGNQETCLAQKDNAPSKAEMSEAVIVASEANPHSVSPVEDPNAEEADTKLHSARKSNDSGRTDVLTGTNIEVSKEPSIMRQSSSSISGCSDYPDRPRSPPHVLVNLQSSQENASSATALRYDLSNQETLQPVGGSHIPPAPPSTPDYGLNLKPPAVQLEGLDTQGGNSVVPSSSSTPSMTQPRGIGQSSIAVSPQMFPFLRQTYPPNYIPYNPYYSQIYMPPQHPHQMMSHSGFPHQPSAGNMYMPPTAAASGVKFPVPPVYKPGNVAGNMTHYGMSPNYGSYGTSGLGYGSSGALPPRTSSNDDIVGPEFKDKNMYSTIKQNEDLHALRDPSAVQQTNMVYNMPQGQAMAYQAAAQVGHNSYGGGMYHQHQHQHQHHHHPSQGMPSRSLVHQPQPTGAAAMEPTGPPLTSYSQQPQLLPLPQQYGQMNWNQNFLNRENV